MLESIINLGKQENIRERWSLNITFPTPSPTEIAALGEIKQFIDSETVITSSGIAVQLGKHIDPYLAYLLCCDAFEHEDINLIRIHAGSANRALVLGAGIGVIASALAKHTGAKTTVYEANEHLLPCIRETAELNDVCLDVRQGLIARERGKKMAFHLSSEFWASSLNENTYKKSETIELTTLAFREVVADAEVVFIDIEGGEIELFYEELPQSLREIFIEIHTPSIGAIEASKIMNRIWAQGFKLIDQKGLTSFWRR